VVDMSKINNQIAIFIVFLILVLLVGLFIKTPANTKTPVQEKQVAGFFIEFEEGTTEPEVKAILENYNMTINIVDYNSDIMPSRYYMILDRDKTIDIEELVDDINLTGPVRKGSNYILTVTEQAIQDKNFLSILEKNNLPVKNSILCIITLGDGSKNWIWEKDAIRIENELKMNEKVLTIMSSGST
jgi:hypothetical protein